jgi:putative ABC transport system ATP-binding protein
MTARTAGPTAAGATAATGTNATADVLELDRVTCRFTDGGTTVTALDDVTLAVGAGELVAVMGPSGSGKSTLVHVACGLVVPTTGVVQVCGLVSTERHNWWTAARRQVVGVVHQRFNLLPTLSALDNVALPLRLDGQRPDRARADALRRLAQVGVDALAHQRADRLSTGQQQLVAIARAMVGERRLVLADEPTAALDTVLAEQVVELLAALAAQHGVAVLMVTHDSRLASWADRVLVLRDGRLVDEVSSPAGADPAGSTGSSGPASGPGPEAAVR